MLPFLKIPVAFPGADTEGTNVMGEGRIQPDAIEDMVTCHDGVILVMKSGAILHTSLTMEQMDATLTGYWKSINEQMQKLQNKPNLSIIN